MDANLEQQWIPDMQGASKKDYLFIWSDPLWKYSHPAPPFPGRKKLLHCPRASYVDPLALHLFLYQSEEIQDQNLIAHFHKTHAHISSQVWDILILSIIILSPMKVFEWKGRFFCFCHVLKTPVFEIRRYEMIEQNFSFHFLPFPTRYVEQPRTWHLW